MSPQSIGLVQGTLDMLILKTLALEPMHGYGIGVRIEQISKSAFQVNAGSLVPALNRLERAGYLAKEWRDTPKNPRAPNNNSPETWDERALPEKKGRGKNAVPRPRLNTTPRGE